MRCLQIFLWLLGIQVVISRYAQAQSHADTTGIVRALARIITEEAARPGSQHGAFVWKDSASSAWSRLVATELRNRNTDLVATREPNALYIAISEVTVAGNTASATIIWLRCTGPSDTVYSRLNYWEHHNKYHMIRTERRWAESGQKDVTFADGHC